MAFEHSFANDYLDALRRFVDFVTNGNPVWAASTAYTAGQRINPANGYRYECTTAGTSGASSPTWPTVVGSTVADGTLTWTCIATTLPTAQAWTVLQQTFTTSADGLVYLKAPGLSGTQSIYMGIQTTSNSVTPNYSWQLAGMLTYSATNSFTNQFSEVSLWYINLLHNTTFEYYFVGNGQRAAGFFITGGVTQSFYMGFINPYAPPSNWTYPLYIGGMSYNAPQTNANTSQAYFLYNGSLFFTDNIWRNTTTQANGTFNATSIVNYTNIVFPYEKVAQNAGNIIPNVSGYTVFPCAIGFTDPTVSLTMPVGEFDGVMDVIKYQQITGDIVTANGSNYVMFNNNNLTGPIDYLALKLE